MITDLGYLCNSICIVTSSLYVVIFGYVLLDRFPLMTKLIRSDSDSAVLEVLMINRSIRRNFKSFLLVVGYINLVFWIIGYCFTLYRMFIVSGLIQLSQSIVSTYIQRRIYLKFDKLYEKEVRNKDKPSSDAKEELWESIVDWKAAHQIRCLSSINLKRGRTSS
ncbi:hypothetical protein PPL_09624 [Heterostelium album PN500]|uniref:Uncharacterized protein n=1 Tax=Heterostelium pallidum (strain ATCC 26659 / Pp 5 / PN500) TaxID=670386 RepID=D3BNV3_HETP5|nr:hypothetical protein PPL_09624 [Heterostelium album PN500]EFA76872.1 hypothetical protein PPL_09624 [Heterostelium album PN500]|eukprot:XP_020429004.1 hypothetical protein PPL_09624 [Heterostelium album PN500]